MCSILRFKAPTMSWPNTTNAFVHLRWNYSCGRYTAVPSNPAHFSSLKPVHTTHNKDNILEKILGLLNEFQNRFQVFLSLFTFSTTYLPNVTNQTAFQHTLKRYIYNRHYGFILTTPQTDVPLKWQLLPLKSSACLRLLYIPLWADVFCNVHKQV